MRRHFRWPIGIGDGDRRGCCAGTFRLLILIQGRSGKGGQSGSEGDSDRLHGTFLFDGGFERLSRDIKFSLKQRINSNKCTTVELEILNDGAITGRKSV